MLGSDPAELCVDGWTPKSEHLKENFPLFSKKKQTEIQTLQKRVDIIGEWRQSGPQRLLLI